MLQPPSAEQGLLAAIPQQAQCRRPVDQLGLGQLNLTLGLKMRGFVKPLCAVMPTGVNCPAPETCFPAQAKIKC